MGVPMEASPTPATLKRHYKYTFWLILGALSTYFAEVVTASTPFPFFTPSGILVTYPFYTLNILVFSYIAFRKKKVDLYTLFLAGQVFGLFEAYGTKMLWSSSWGAEPRILGISVIPFFLLIFLWHPLMSFTLPLLIAETYLTGSEEIVRGIPRWLSHHLQAKKTTYIVFGIFVLFCAVNQAINSPSRRVSLMSPSISWGVIVLASTLWRRKAPRIPLRDLLPTKREMVVITPPFLLMYLLLGLYLFPEGIPPLRQQTGVWILYILLGVLLYLDISSPHAEYSDRLPMVPWRVFALLGFVVAVVAPFIPKSVPLVVAAWIPGVALGILIFCGAVFRMVKNKRKRE